MTDQAETLREMVSRKTKIIAFLTSGKGEGLYSIIMNLAVACIILKKRVLIMDSGTVLLRKLTRGQGLKGGKRYKTSIDLLEKGSRIQEVLAKTPYGVRLISGIEELLHERIRERGDDALEHVKSEFSKLHEADFIFLHLSPGKSSDNIHLVSGSDKLIIVSTPDIEKIQKSYGVLKYITHYTRSDVCPDISYVVNKSKSDDTSRQIVERLQKGAEKMLGKQFDFRGAVPTDYSVPSAYAVGKPYVVQNPKSPASVSLMKIAEELVDESESEQAFSDVDNLFSGLKKFIDIFR